jgi:alkane 1-monooxygenase
MSSSAPDAVTSSDRLEPSLDVGDMRATPLPGDDDAVSLDPTPSALRLWCLHLLCFVVPVTTLGFLLTGPHRWWAAVLWVLPLIASVVIDNNAGPARHQPAAMLPGWAFNAVLYVLVALQLVNIALLGRMISLAGFWTIDTLAALVLVGTNSGYSGIVAAHELIHRPQRHNQLLGRLLLMTVMYEHFYTEHLRGHHVRVGTRADPATARFGEEFEHFWRRTVPAQFKSAWRLETKRLGDENMRVWDPRLLRSRVVHGLIGEISIAALIFTVFGGAALGVYLLQAFGAVRLLEAVNYFEHWGLTRTARKVTPIDSWDTDSWFTLYTLIGLSRHADHHAHATRPYQELRYFEESPKLPHGYFGMVVMVLIRNRRFIALMTSELERKKLGPFAIERAELAAN